jgi:hypothetical protein
LLAWSAANVGSLTNSTGDDPASTLRRVQADPRTREAVRARLKFGMTLVTTDELATAATRSHEGFVVIDSMA